MAESDYNNYYESLGSQTLGADTGTAGTSAIWTWRVWNGGTSTIDHIDTGAVWNQWTTSYTVLDYVQVTAREAQCRQVIEVAERAEAVRKAANERAERLLVECLSPAQRALYEKDRFFEVVTKRGRYRIKPGNRVRLYDEPGLVAQFDYCIHPEETVPAADTALAQKLLLEADEAAFLATANAIRL